MLPETVSDLHRIGALRALQPKRWGGMELPPIEMIRSAVAAALVMGNIWLLIPALLISGLGIFLILINALPS